jgi:ribonucleoside-diphosphate reductase beta chain
MTQYLEFVADRLLVELGCDREYTAAPLIMDMIHGAKTNFFERKLLNTNEVQSELWIVTGAKNSFDRRSLSIFQSDK